MSASSQSLAAFLSAHADCVRVSVANAKGSTPREAGAFMLVAAPGAIWGTIGGGQLEYLAIDAAQQMLKHGEARQSIPVPLGPEIGQCCGGRVLLDLDVLGRDDRLALCRRVEADERNRPNVYVFGAGHVGRALAAHLALLPVAATLADVRREALDAVPPGVATLATPLPEAVVRDAPSGSAFAIMTHDHALDFLITAEALRRKDAAYVGLIGSQSKRARFSSWYRSQGGAESELARLVSPIGAVGLGDKRPAVIAAFAAAEILLHLGPGGRRGAKGAVARAELGVAS